MCSNNPKSYDVNHHCDFLLTILGPRLKNGPYCDTIGLKPKEKNYDKINKTIESLWKLFLKTGPHHFCSWFIQLTGEIVKPDVNSAGMCNPLSGSGSQKLRRIIHNLLLSISGWPSFCGG